MNTLLNLARAAMCAGLAAAALAQPAAATTLSRVKSFEGNINFVGTQASLQSKKAGAHVCELESEAQAGIVLPPNASLVSATLYWTGTGAAARDTEVLLNGTRVSAPPGRRYSSSIDGFSYFSAAAEVTALVQGALVGNKASLRFSGLDVDVSAAYCAKQQKENTMVAGFALVAVYAHKDERYRSVNVYEGLQAIKNSSVTVSMPDYTPSAANSGSGRLGYIVWEGDKSGNQKDDYVEFAGEVLRSEPFIQKKDAFNSKSGANSDENSPGIDFDIVDLPATPARALDAKAVFTTGSDRVLLGTAIVALSSAPSADLAISKSRAGEFKPGSEVTYTLEVVNQGARGDSAVVVKDALPAALAYVSSSGAGWSCTVAGQEVSCKYGKELAPNARASVQVKVRITGEGTIRNTATVSGTADGVPANDSSTVEDSVSAQPAGTVPFVFTVGKCEPGDEVKAGGAAGCALFQGPVTAGSKPAIYLTHAVNGVARALDPVADKSMGLRFSLECNNPDKGAGTDASYAGGTLDACLDNASAIGAASGTPVTMKFSRGAASVPATFHYPDVGLVTLRLRDDAGNIAKTSFASVPAALSVQYMRADGVLNPGKPALPDAAFAEAGEPFLVLVSARGQDVAGPLPNFGRESGEHAAAGRLRVAVEDELQGALLEAQGAWTPVEKRPGELARTYVWKEAGMASLSGSLASYLGVTSLDTKHEPVGRFYPQYFKTETAGGFGCLKRMKCPADEAAAISRAVFSKQTFGVIVRAYGRHGLLQKFVHAPDDPSEPAPVFVPEISLGAVSAPGPDGKALDKFVNGAPSKLTERELAYGLSTGFDARALTRDWTPPTAVYARAQAQELRKTAAGAEAVQITSAGSAAHEGGIMVVNGRLMVANVIGTPLARTAVPLRAQYWSGLAWEHNGGVEQAAAVQGKVEFSACRRSLRMSLGGGCDPAIKVFGANKATDTITLPLLKEGKASLVLAPVGADKSGNVDLFIDAIEQLPYLPSTVGRVSFGQFKSPVIYVREMY